jgi:hypothetical protein
MARVQRQKKRVQQNFSLKDYVTWEAAESAAAKWIASILPSLPAKIPSKDRMTHRNHSGVVGVYYTQGTRTLNSGTVADYPGYVAQIPGRDAGIKWMLSTCNGDDLAFVHAYVCRKLETADRTEVEEYVRTMSREERTEILKLKKVKA